MKSSKKILGASAALGLAVALSAGSTFAWFTTGRSTVDVDSFKLQATTSAGGEADLRVAIYPIGDTANTVSSGDFSHTVQLYTENAPQNSVAAQLNNAIVPLQPLSWINNEFVDVQENPATSGYVKFRLVFESDEELEIYLDSKSSVTPEATNSKSITISKAANESIYNNFEASKYGATTAADGVTKNTTAETYTLIARAANAARIKFAENTTTAVSDAAENIWCPNEYYVTGQAANVGTGGSDEADVAKNANPKGFYGGNLAGDLYGLKDSVAIEAESYSGVVGYDTTATGEGANANATLIATTRENSKLGISVTTAGFHAVVDVAIWLEGSDGDCFTSILSDYFNVALSFKGVPVA